MVDFEYGIIHGHPFYSVIQFVEEDGPGCVEILVVHAHRKDEVPYFPFRNRFSPRHLGEGFLREPVVFKIIFSVMVEDVSYRHVCIKEFEGFTFVRCERSPEDTEGLLTVEGLPLCCKILFDLFTIIRVVYKMVPA